MEFTGIFTPTEAAAVAVFYVLLAGTLINRELIGVISSRLLEELIVTGILGPIIAFSILFGETLAILRVPGSVVSFLSACQLVMSSPCS